MYDKLANINKNKKGAGDFADHNINSSGGIKPKSDSEIKKHEKIIFGEYVSRILLINKLISIIKKLTIKNNNTKSTITKNA